MYSFGQRLISRLVEYVSDHRVSDSRISRTVYLKRERSYTKLSHISGVSKDRAVFRHARY